MTSNPTFNIVFDSSSDESDDYLYSDSSSSFNFQPPNSTLRNTRPLPNMKRVHNHLVRTRRNIPSRLTESCFVKSMPKLNDTNQPQRPKTSEKSTTSSNKLSTEMVSLNEPTIIPEHCYIIEQSKIKSLFCATHLRFKLIDDQKIIFDLTINSNDQEILLPYEKKLLINTGKTQFIMKSNGIFPTDIFSVKFKSPLEGDECERREVVKFMNKMNNSIPSQMESLGILDENATNGHFYKKSVINSVLVARNKKTPLLSIFSLGKERLEIITRLNIPVDIVFALGIASFLGAQKFTRYEYSENYRLKLGFPALFRI